MVKRICLDLAQESKGLARGLWANLHRIRTIHREVATVGADAVVSFGTTVNILALLACVGTGMRVFISERTNPGAHEIARQWRVLRHITYRRASALVVQTRGAAEWFRARMGGNPPVVVIANPVKPELNRERLDVVPPPRLLWLWVGSRPRRDSMSSCARSRRWRSSARASTWRLPEKGPKRQC